MSRIGQAARGPHRRFRRALARRRRYLAAGLLALAAATTVQALTPPAADTEAVEVVVRDLPAGHLLSSADLEVAHWAPGTAPQRQVARPVGRVLAAPVRRGEPITDVRVTGAALLHGQPRGTRAVAVRLSDPAATLLVQPGERADLLAGAAPSGSVGSGSSGGSGGSEPVGEVVLSNVLVLAVPGSAAPDSAAGDSGGSLLGSGLPDSSAGGGQPDGSAVIIIAVDARQAMELAAVAGVRPLSLAARAGDNN